MINGELFILLGAEGCSEIEGEAWARQATEDEVQEQRDALGIDDNGRPKFDKLLIDMNGRPYFSMVLGLDAPERVRSRAREHLRVVRL
jgi:hypothetical protein